MKEKHEYTTIYVSQNNMLHVPYWEVQTESPFRCVMFTRECLA